MSDELRSESVIFSCLCHRSIIPKLHSLKSSYSLDLAGLSLEFSELFDKMPFRILLIVLFHVFRCDDDNNNSSSSRRSGDVIVIVGSISNYDDDDDFKKQ